MYVIQLIIRNEQQKNKKQALELSDEERAELAHLLIDSLNPEAEYESEQEWSKELKKRIEWYEKGVSSTKSWSEVKKERSSSSQ